MSRVWKTNNRLKIKICERKAILTLNCFEKKKNSYLEVYSFKLLFKKKKKLEKTSPLILSLEFMCVHFTNLLEFYRVHLTARIRPSRCINMVLVPTKAMGN